MNGFFKKLSAIFLVAVIILASSPLSGLPEIAYAVSYSGSCGDEASWALDIDTDALTISGSGNTYDYVQTTAPWFGYEITSVTVEEGITGIGDYPVSYTHLTLPTMAVV